MPTRLAEIDSLLAKCALQLAPNRNGVADVSKVRGLIDDLLDERNRLVPPGPVKVAHSKACTICYQPLRIRRIQPDPRVGGIAVDFTNCDTCDRAKCRCGVYVRDISAKQCPAGHWLDRQGQSAI